MMPRVLSGLVGVFYLVQAMQWLIAPAKAAGGLGMPLLDGIARSTQVGDFSAFFFTLGALGLLGAYQPAPQWPRAAALLIGSAAVTRTISWLFHGADFAVVFIAVETVSAGILLFVARRFQAIGDAPTTQSSR